MSRESTLARSVLSTWVGKAHQALCKGRGLAANLLFIISPPF